MRRFRELSFLLVAGWLLLPIGSQASESQIVDPAAAQKLYQTRCAKCHKMYDPAKYSQQKWDYWMDKMSRKARLKPAQKQAVVEYINKELRPQTKGKETPPPATAPQ